jgi:hypothetical protein
LKTVTPSNTLLRIVVDIDYSEGGERSVHRHGMVDHGTTGGFERKEEETRGPAELRDYSGDVRLFDSGERRVDYRGGGDIFEPP